MNKVPIFFSVYKSQLSYFGIYASLPYSLQIGDFFYSKSMLLHIFILIRDEGNALYLFKNSVHSKLDYIHYASQSFSLYPGKTLTGIFLSISWHLKSVLHRIAKNAIWS